MIDPLVWNPEFGYGGAGDFTNYAVASAGNSVLSDPLASDLPMLDEGWRQSLFDESGAIPGGSRGWVLGLVLAVGIVVLGIFLAVADRRSKQKIEERLRDLEFLEEQSRAAREKEAVRTSVGGGRRRDAGVGRSGSPSRGVDRDQGDRSPSGGAGGAGRDRVPDGSETGDDLFQHPDFDDEG